MILPFSMKHHKVPSLNLYRLFTRDEVQVRLPFFLLTCTLNDTVSSNATSALFCFLFQKGTGGHQDSPLKLVPQLSRFHHYSSFTNNPSITKKENRGRFVCFISVVECTQGVATSGCETNNN